MAASNPTPRESARERQAPEVGVDHPTVVPSNFDPNEDDE